jgi:hypothetical protein
MISNDDKKDDEKKLDEDKMYENLPEVDIKNEDSIFEVFKINEYDTIMTQIVKSIDNYYHNMEAFDDYPYFRVQNTVQFIPKLNTKSEILTDKMLKQIHSHLPYYHQFKNLKLVFSISQHGTSIKT